MLICLWVLLLVTFKSTDKFLATEFDRSLIYEISSNYLKIGIWIEDNLISTAPEASVQTIEVLLQIDQYYGSESNRASADLLKQFGTSCLS